MALATAMTTLILCIVIMLTQSLRFLELVLNSGASAWTFWILTLLVLPRFLVVVLPLSVMAGVLFVYNRMSADSEIVAAKSAGVSLFKLAKPAIILATLCSLFLWSITLWAAPASLSKLQEMREIIRAQISHYLIHEGVFNQIGDDVTVYVRQRLPNGDLRGVMIHDARDNQDRPSTIFARRGGLVTSEDAAQVVVYDGTRQQFDEETQSLNSLYFERYTLDLPDSGPIRTRWLEPDERSLSALLFPDLSVARNVESLSDFTVELHRRFITPWLALVYTLIACAALLCGSLQRRGQSRRIATALLAVVFIQGGVLSGLNIARHSDWGLLITYLLIIVPSFISIKMLYANRYQFWKRDRHQEVTA